MADLAAFIQEAFGVTPFAALVFVAVCGVIWFLTKRTIERVTGEQLEAVKSQLRTVEQEAAQLRAHSLGLEAERRRNFEARRAEVCEAAFLSLLELMEGIQRWAIVGVELDEAGADPDEAQRRLAVRNKAEALATTAAARSELAGLYTSEPLATAMSRLSLFSWQPITSFSQSRAEATMFEYRDKLDKVRVLMRKELRYPLASAEEPKSEETAP